MPGPVNPYGFVPDVNAEAEGDKALRVFRALRFWVHEQQQEVSTTISVDGHMLILSRIPPQHQPGGLIVAR